MTCPAGRKKFFGQLGLRSGFCETKDIRFGNVTARVFKDIESHMIRLYGPGYMTPPSEKDRESHIFLRPFEV